MQRTPDDTIRVRVHGRFTQGAPITTSTEQVQIPASRITANEVVLQLAQALPEYGLAPGDLLILEPRQTAATSEMVIATIHERAFLGRWWTKHATRQLLDETFTTIAEGTDLVLFGAISLIIHK
jgi:hypothetical protein